MIKKIKLVALIVIIGFITVAAAGMYKFNYLASKPGYDVDGNKTETRVE